MKKRSSKTRTLYEDDELTEVGGSEQNIREGQPFDSVLWRGPSEIESTYQKLLSFSQSIKKMSLLVFPHNHASILGGGGGGGVGVWGSG